MTRHLGEDTILKLALDLLEPAARRAAWKHLESCSRCAVALRNVEKGIRTISDVDPVLQGVPPPLPREAGSRLLRWRMVAALAAGIGLGVLSSEFLRPPSVTVVPQRILSNPRGTIGFVVCDPIDLPVRLR